MLNKITMFRKLVKHICQVILVKLMW